MRSLLFLTVLAVLSCAPKVEEKVLLPVGRVIYAGRDVRNYG